MLPGQSDERRTDVPNAATPSDRVETRLKILIAFLGVVAALLTVATGVLSYMTSQSNKDAADAAKRAAEAQSSVQTLETAVSTLNSVRDDNLSALSSASSVISSLQQENQALSRQLTPAASTTSGSTAGQVRHSGPYDVVPSGNSPDLDARADNIQWTGDFYSGDFSPTSDKPPGLNPGDPTVKFVVIPQTAASYEVCLNATAYAFATLNFTDVSPGDLVCVQTNGGRLSAMQVTAVNDDRVSLLITTYEK